MASSARVPLLEVRSVALGLGLPPEQTIHQGKPAKYLLHQAFRRDRLEEIVNRPKQEFSNGTGSSDIIRMAAGREISDSRIQIERDRLRNRWGYHLANKEAHYYYLIPRRFFKDGFYRQWDKAKAYELFDLQMAVSAAI